MRVRDESSGSSDYDDRAALNKSYRRSRRLLGRRQSPRSVRLAMVGDEVRDRRGDPAAIGACLGEFGRDLLGHVARPTLGGVESDDAALEGALRLVYAAMWIITPTTRGELWRSLCAALTTRCRRACRRRDLRGDAHQRARRLLRAVRARSVHHGPLFGAPLASLQ